MQISSIDKLNFEPFIYFNIIFDRTMKLRTLSNEFHNHNGRSPLTVDQAQISEMIKVVLK